MNIMIALPIISIVLYIAALATSYHGPNPLSAIMFFTASTLITAFFYILIFNNLANAASSAPSRSIQVSFDDIKVNVNHKHDHYFHGNKPNFTEGVEKIEVKPDGTSVTTRHIKKWN
jgi:hypothetical protein